MKLLAYDGAFKPADLSNDTPYVIMFGPDRCGATDKVPVLSVCLSVCLSVRLFVCLSVYGAPVVLDALLVHLH